MCIWGLPRLEFRSRLASFEGRGACTVALALVAGGCVAGPGPGQPFAESSVEAAPIRQGPEQRCDAPGERRFVDQAADAGIAFVPAFADLYSPGEPFLPLEGYSSTDIENQGGMAVADFDGDGQLDLAVVEAVGGPRVFRGEGGLVFSEWLGAWPERHYTGLSAADVDADGLVDLYLLADGPNVLMRSTPTGFEDATEALGLGGGPGNTLTAS